jgi:hypothetical protein
MIEITTEKRADDWMAYLSTNKGIWGCGRTEDEAVGSFMRILASFDSNMVRIASDPNRNAAVRAEVRVEI